MSCNNDNKVVVLYNLAMNKKIVIGAICLVIALLIVFKKVEYVPYEGPVKSSTRIVGNYEITTKSVTQIVASGPLQNYCDYINREYYEDPQIIVKDKVTNTEKKYRLNSEKGYVRITIGGGSTKEAVGITDIFVTVNTIGKECSLKTWNGLIVVNKGDVFPLTPDITSARSDVYITDGSKKIFITLLPQETKGWYGDYNNDGMTDFFITEQNPTNMNERLVYMWEVPTNTFATWFNNGNVLVTERTIEEIDNNWTTSRVFINTHITN